MDSNDILSKVQKVHFVGSEALACAPLFQPLLGYQLPPAPTPKESDTYSASAPMESPASMGHRAENIGDAELVVYTAAVKQDNPSQVARLKRGVLTARRSVMCSAW